MKRTLENLEGSLAAVEEALKAETDEAKRTRLEHDARYLRLAVSEARGESLSGSGAPRP